MIPYSDFFYFSILIYPAAVAIGLGLAGRLSWRWVLGINVAMLIVQYAGGADLGSRESVPKIWIVAAYGAFQYSVATIFLHLRRRAKSKHLFRAALILVALPMAIVKLFPLGLGASYVGFLGISYATFRGLDVIFCIQDRLITSLSPGQYLAYLLFFPTVSSGPLDRYNRFVTDWVRRRTRNEFLQDLDSGVDRVFRGLLYKFILAALIKKYWLDPVATHTSALSIASYMYAYTFFLFFDFAGYSAFAIGVGDVLGIHTPENFNRPFLARDIVDFWNRWHISLSTWFRDHVYMRFIMAATRGRWFAGRIAMSCAGFYLSFLLMGMWHGLALRYFVYGVYHATLMAIHTIWADRRIRLPTGEPHQMWNPVGTVVTFHLVCFGLLIFSGRLG